MIITLHNTALLNLLLPRTLLNNNPLLLRLRPSRLLGLNNLDENLNRKSVTTTTNSFFKYFYFILFFPLSPFKTFFYFLLLHEIYSFSTRNLTFSFIFNTGLTFDLIWLRIRFLFLPTSKIPKTENTNQITLVRWQTINK
jgi:hypothetical protein